MSVEKPSAKNNGRAHIRSRMRARIKMIHPSIGEIFLYIEDLSDGGLFVLRDGTQLPEIGETVQIQVQDLPVEAPVLKAQVRRANAEGIGLMFVED